MNEDTKIFWKYFFHSLKPRIAIRTSNLWLWTATIISLIVVFLKIQIYIKFIIVGFLLLSVAILNIYQLYKSGEHRFWYRQLQGIPSKSEIKEMKNIQSGISPASCEGEAGLS